jgi:COMPASS component BRE2
MLAESDDLLEDVVRVDITPLVNAAPLATTSTAASTSRKRKHASNSGSNAPSGTSSPAPEAIPPRQHITKGPLVPSFVPISEGSEFCAVDHVVLNHNGFRYHPACASETGSAISVRTAESTPTHYRVSWEDRNPAIKVTQDGLRICGADGFRSARCNAPVREGKWYMEVTIEAGGGSRLPDSKRAQGAHVRLGWARREATLGGPAGMDGYSYAYRDMTGDKITISRPKAYGRPFGVGDVVGMYISLPPLRPPVKNDPADPAHLHRERIAIQVGKEHAYFESKEYPATKEMIDLVNRGKLREPEAASAPVKKAKGAPRTRNAKGPPLPPVSRPIPTLDGSRVAFFVNGECQGTAFSEIFDFRPLRTDTSAEANKNKRRRDGLQAHRDNPFDDGTLGYYPFFSLFNDARIRLNTGPHFQHPPPDDVDALLDAHNAGNTREDAMDEDIKPADRQPTWRPICERYSEFFQEQWELDTVDEEKAKQLASQAAAKDKEKDSKGPDHPDTIDVARRAAKRLRDQERRKRIKLAKEGGSVKPVAVVAGGSKQGSPDVEVDMEEATGRGTPDSDFALLVDDLERDDDGVSRGRRSGFRSSVTTPAPEFDYAPSPLRNQLDTGSSGTPVRYSPGATESSEADVDHDLAQFVSEEADGGKSEGGDIADELEDLLAE